MVTGCERKQLHATWKCDAAYPSDQVLWRLAEFRRLGRKVHDDHVAVARACQRPTPRQEDRRLVLRDMTAGAAGHRRKRVSGADQRTRWREHGGHAPIPEEEVGAGERGVAAEVDLDRRREPAQMVRVPHAVHRGQERRLRQVELPARSAPVRERCTSLANTGQPGGSSSCPRIRLASTTPRRRLSNLASASAPLSMPRCMLKASLHAQGLAPRRPLCARPPL